MPYQLYRCFWVVKNLGLLNIRQSKFENQRCLHNKNAQFATSLLTSCNRLVINKPISGNQDVFAWLVKTLVKTTNMLQVVSTTCSQCVSLLTSSVFIRSVKIKLGRSNRQGVTRALIGGVYSYIRVLPKGGFTVRANASREMNHSFARTESRFAFSRETSNMAVLSRRQITIVMLLSRRLRRKNINKSTRNKRRFWVRQIYRETKQICCNSETNSGLETMFAS